MRWWSWSSSSVFRGRRRLQRDLEVIVGAGSLGVLVGWATSPWAQHRQGDVVVTVERPAPSTSDDADRHEAAALGLPRSMGVHARRDYVSAYDWRTRNPLWVAQVLRRPKEPSGRSGSRTGVRFTPDPAVPEPFRTQHRDFTGSGFDRGHMAPSADAIEQDGLQETFLMSNISPQIGDGFNRTYWARIERFVRGLTRQYDRVYVVSGPLFLEDGQGEVRYRLIGPSGIAVPTHFFKAVLAVRPPPLFSSKPILAAAAFVVPNRPIADGDALSSFQVPLETLEKQAGLVLWDRVDRAEVMDLCADTTCALSTLRRFTKAKHRQLPASEAA